MLPLLGVTFFSLQLDRGNIGVALSGGIAESLKISTNQINIGVQLMYLGVVLLEVPSNIVLQRVGRSRQALSLTRFRLGHTNGCRRRFWRGLLFRLCSAL